MHLPLASCTCIPACTNGINNRAVALFARKKRQRTHIWSLAKAPFELIIYATLLLIICDAPIVLCHFGDLMHVHLLSWLQRVFACIIHLSTLKQPIMVSAHDLEMELVDLHAIIYQPTLTLHLHVMRAFSLKWTFMHVILAVVRYSPSWTLTLK